ncbi:MAG TPA: glycosyltransferase family 1 protein, partial [bacterium]|nr:glycosyltransferase family 1 protein [bacterium]
MSAMRVLCNLPLECFDERAALRDVELCTFGPPERMLVDGVHFPFDVAFDPSRGTWEELRAALPADFEPDLVLLYWPDQEPLPAGIERCPVPVVGVVSDYNLTLPYIAALWPFFDSLLCDRSGVDLFRRLSFADVRYWCQFAHKRPFHHLRPDAGPRDLDVGFAGNLNPAVQRERAPWLDRVRSLGERGVRVEVTTGMHGEAYGRFLNRCRIGFNRSIRGEMNLRAFEVPACGALLLMERDNLEVRDFFEPGEECVLYGDDDFEDVVERLVRDAERTARIAAAGHRRVQRHRLGERLRDLLPLAAGGLRRPASDDRARTLGRALAMLPTWADGEAVARAALAANRAAPHDPRTLNLLALASLRWRGGDGAEQAFQLWQRAAQVAPDYLPAVVNLTALAQASGDPSLVDTMRAERDRRLGNATDWRSLDGPTLPFGFAPLAIDRSL